MNHSLQELQLITLIYGKEESLVKSSAPSNLDLDGDCHPSSEQGRMLARTHYFITGGHILTFTRISIQPALDRTPLFFHLNITFSITSWFVSFHFKDHH